MMKLTLNTISPLLCASGESSAHIDADFKYDKYGFPYIQGRTIKGLLRESAEEVCEMLGIKNSLVASIFGISGSNGSKLYFNDFKIVGNSNMIYLLNTDEYKMLPESLIKTYYTEFRRQTAIEKGVAKDKSLRTYRLIKEGITFEGCIVGFLNEGENELLKNAIINLIYIGSRRNRGFGKVKFSLEKSVSGNQETEVIYPNIENQITKTLKFSITTLSPLAISKIIGEQNTVTTEQFIPSQNIRGLTAQLIIENNPLMRDQIKLDKTFKAIILDGRVNFNPAFIKETLPIPKIYGYDKINPESKAEFVFKNKSLPLKGLSGFGKIDPKSIFTKNINTVFSFHNSRKDNRSAGRSTEDKGAIFYYEAIDTGQV
ncbi:MAG: RAMP superfamily CRISPR-associated protein, partial [Saprospiraceae bacterium]